MDVSDEMALLIRHGDPPHESLGGFVDVGAIPEALHDLKNVRLELDVALDVVSEDGEARISRRDRAEATPRRTQCPTDDAR